MKLFRITTCAACLLFLGGCFFQQEAPDYRDSADLPPLELPPDLSAPSSSGQIVIPSANTGVVAADTRPAATPPAAAESSGSTVAADAVLPGFAVAQTRRDGQLQWLEVASSPELIWPELEAFWAGQNTELSRNEPRIGIMETAWRDDASPDLPQGGAVAQPTQSKFKVRLERSGSGTNIFLNQLLARQTGESDEGLPAWTQEAGSPEFEAETLSRLRVFLGDRLQAQTPAPAVEQIPAGPPSASLRTLAGIPVLTIGDQISRTWSSTRAALGEASFSVRQADQSKGVFFVKDELNEVDDRGLLSKVFGKGKKSLGAYQVHLLGQASQTLITIHRDDDETLDPVVANGLLARLQKAFEKQGT